jgi:hypothetical protein
MNYYLPKKNSKIFLSVFAGMLQQHKISQGISKNETLVGMTILAAILFFKMPCINFLFFSHDTLWVSHENNNNNNNNKSC